MKDSHLRSLIKGITWRITGTADTIFLAFLVTASLGNAVMIGLSETITKLVLYYVHERVWNIVKWGRNAGGPSHFRSFIKGVTWRITGTMDTIMLSYIVTGHIENSVTIGGMELITKVILYYCHERLWALTRWGRIADDSALTLK